MSLSQNDICEDLELFERGELQPDPDFSKIGLYIAHEIFESLKTSGLFSVDRVRIAGSRGKGIAVHDTDFDIIVFLNHILPPFSRSLVEGMWGVVRAWLWGQGFLWGKVKVNTYSAQFTVRVGGRDYEFDLLPAANLLSLSDRSKIITGDRRDVTVFQADQTRRRLRCYYLKQYGNLRVVNTLVLFLKARPVEVRKVIKLARYWGKGIDLGGVIVPGKSMIFELVAVWAQRGRRHCSLLGRFVRFLEEMKDFSNLEVIFGHHYERGSIPPFLLEKTPVVMDPHNPFNNLTKDLGSGVILTFERCATQTLHKIRKGDISSVRDLFKFRY